MPPIDYEGRVFASLANSEGGQVGAATCFRYHQQGSIVWADYSGGQIARGHLLATAGPDGNLDARYHHIDIEGNLLTGCCRSTLTILADGRYRLAEDWAWTGGREGAGRSTVEEVSAN